MIIEKQVIHFSEYMQALRCELDAAIANGYTHNGITLNAEHCKVSLWHHTASETFYVEMVNTLTTPSDYRTHNLHADRNMLEKTPMPRLCQAILTQLIGDIRYRVESSCVRQAIESQHLTVGRIVDLPHGYPQMYSTVYAKRVMLTSQRLSGYGALDFQVAAGGASPTDDFTVIAAYNALLPDGTKSETVHLPWIGCTLKELETFDLVLRNIIDVLVEVTSCR